MVSEIVAGGFVPAEGSIRVVMMWVIRVKRELTHLILRSDMHPPDAV
jgi:hypothetical protein